MRAFFLASFLSSLASTALAVFGSSTAKADEPTRSKEARLADVRLDVGIGLQGYGENGAVGVGGAFEPYFRTHFGFADPDRSVRNGFAVHDDAWFELGGIGAKNAGGFGLVGAGFALMPGFRTDYFGAFFGPSVRVEGWLGGNKTTHAFTTTSVPFEARLELFEGPSSQLPRVIVTGWFAGWPSGHRTFGGRLDVALDAQDPTWFFLSLDRSEGIESEKEKDAEWSVAHGPAWDFRAGVSVGFR